MSPHDRLKSNLTAANLLAALAAGVPLALLLLLAYLGVIN
jgi:hypothetical protein